MAEFKPINTQEEFDTAIQERLDRERRKYADYEDLKRKAGELETLKGKRYEDTIAGLQKQLEEANGKLAGLDELTKRAEGAEIALLKHKIAHESKIPYELAGRLTGTSEEELREDAKTLVKYVGAIRPDPLASNEPAGKNDNDASLRELLNSLSQQAV